jgi:hypothetical protein
MGDQLAHPVQLSLPCPGAVMPKQCVTRLGEVPEPVSMPP